MKYMLDTNICSYIIKNRPPEVLKKFKTLTIDDCCISSITLSELRHWVSKNKRLHQQSNNPGAPNINDTIVSQFVNHLRVADFDYHAALVYGEIRDQLEAKGVLVGNMDLLIGAHAISLELTLVTNNLKDFAGFPGIQLENWVTRPA